MLEDDEVTRNEDLNLLVSRVNQKMAQKVGPGGVRQIAEYQQSARIGALWILDLGRLNGYSSKQ